MSEVDNKEYSTYRPRIATIDKYTITLKNVDLSTSQTLVGSIFVLTDDFTLHAGERLVCDGKGEVTFVVMHECTLNLQQTKVAHGYSLIHDQIDIEVKTSGLKILNPTSNNSVELIENSSRHYVLTVKNAKEPEALFSHNITLSKIDSNTEEALTSAEFKLTDPNSVQSNLTCDNKGVCDIHLDKVGKWTLEETKSPPEYQLNPTQIVLNVTQSDITLDNATSLDFVTFDPSLKQLKIKNTANNTKYATNKSLAKLVQLVKEKTSTLSDKVFNIMVNYTFTEYTRMKSPTNKKKFYADILCGVSKATMNAQITPSDNVKVPSLLTYAEPMDGFVRCYFSDEPYENYTVESIELTTVETSQYILKLKDAQIGDKLKFSSGKTFILRDKNLEGHEPNSVTLVSEYIIEKANWGQTISFLESNIYKEILPKYYNELSDLEKKAIVCHKSKVFTGMSYPDSYLIGEELEQPTESYFYLPDAIQIGKKINFTVEGSDWGESEYMDHNGSAMPGLYGAGKKMFKDGSPGKYYTTTMRKYTRRDSTSSYYIACVDEDNSHIATEETLCSNMAINKAPSPDIGTTTATWYTVISGVVPYCDMRGDTLVMKDEDGYWTIIEAPESELWSIM